MKILLWLEVTTTWGSELKGHSVENHGLKVTSQAESVWSFCFNFCMLIMVNTGDKLGPSTSHRWSTSPVVLFCFEAGIWDVPWAYDPPTSAGIVGRSHYVQTACFCLILSSILQCTGREGWALKLAIVRQHLSQLVLTKSPHLSVRFEKLLCRCCFPVLLLVWGWGGQRCKCKLEANMKGSVFCHQVGPRD